MKITDGLLMSVPRGTDTYQAFAGLQSDFGIGTTLPYTLLLEPPAGASAGGARGTVYDETTWSKSVDILENFTTATPLLLAKDFAFPSYAAGSEVPYFIVAACRENRTVAPECREIMYIVDSNVNAAGNAMYGTITPSAFDPLGEDGQKTLSLMRARLSDLERQTGWALSLTGQAVDSMDIISKTYECVPWMVGITLGMALLILALAFRSLVIPLRSVTSICLTLLYIYGWAVLVYQDGWLNWMPFPGVTGKYHAQEWMIPVICVTMVVGICLDYDIFLLTRACEFREAGMTALESTRHAVCSTGGIISAAGVIMAIAFSGLMLTSMLPINCLAFYMVVAVLYDTFVVRCFFAPAAMSLLGALNYWPGRLSKPDR